MNLDPVFDAALAELARELGEKGLAFDDDLCFLDADTPCGVTLKKDEDRSCLVFSGVACPDFPEELRAELADLLLGLALAPLHAHMPGIGYDDDKALVAYRIVPLEEALKKERLAEAYFDFVDYVNAIAALVANTLEERKIPVA